MAVFIDTFITTLRDFGMVEVLTLLMMITITYAVLVKLKLLGDADAQGEQGKRANSIAMVLSLILGFLVFISPIGRSIDIWFTKFFIHILIVLATVLGVYLVAGMGGYNFDNLKSSNWMIWTGLVIGLIVFVNAGGLGLFGIQGNDEGVPGSNPIPGVLFGINWTPELVSQLIGAFIVLAIFLGAIALLFFGKE